MGAIVGAALALGMNSQEIYEFVKTEFSYWKLIDFSFTKGFVAGDKVFKKLQEVYGRSKVSSTQIPLKIVATRLDDCEKIVFENETILDAVRASMSVPGLFTPHIIDGKYYVDGMLSENLPISPLAGKSILAVSTVMSLETPFKNTKQILTKSFNKANFDNEQISLQNPKKEITLIRPVYDEIDFLDFHKFEEIVEIGYIEAKKILEAYETLTS